eukprot:5731202-Prymnesium_polylepis.2
MASRWGWDRPDIAGESVPHYVHRTLQLFRNGSFPLDSMIADFEWCAAPLRKTLDCSVAWPP